MGRETFSKREKKPKEGPAAKPVEGLNRSKKGVLDRRPSANQQ